MPKVPEDKQKKNQTANLVRYLMKIDLIIQREVQFNH